MELKLFFPQVSTGITQGKVTLRAKSQVGRLVEGRVAGAARRGSHSVSVQRMNCGTEHETQDLIDESQTIVIFATFRFLWFCYSFWYKDSLRQNNGHQAVTRWEQCSKIPID